MAVMLYKKGRTAELHGLMCDYITCDEADVDAKIAEGYAKTPAEAHAELEKPKRKRRTKAEIKADAGK